VNELVQNFIEVRQAALHLEKIFNKLKDHFWGDTSNNGGLPYVNKNQNRMNVNIEIEHMALFFHDIMKDQAIYKIMKSAQQSLDDDKATLIEYKIFKDVIKCYKRIYAYCKQCYKVALIRQKFEEPAKAKNDGKVNKCCENKECKNCYPGKPPMGREEVQTVEEDKDGNVRLGQPQHDHHDVDDDEDDEIVDEEDEESSDDDIEFEGQDGECIDDLLNEYQQMMNQKVEEEERNEKLNHQINNLSIEEVVNMIENKKEQCDNNNNKKPKPKKKKNKKKGDSKFEEEIQKDSSSKKAKTKKLTDENSNSPGDSNAIDFKVALNISDDCIQEELVSTTSQRLKLIDNDKPPSQVFYEDFDKYLDTLKWSVKKTKVKPNISMDWLRSLKTRLPV
jgi:hypothetical protein